MVTEKLSLAVDAPGSAPHCSRARCVCACTCVRVCLHTHVHTVRIGPKSGDVWRSSTCCCAFFASLSFFRGG